VVSRPIETLTFEFGVGESQLLGGGAQAQELSADAFGA
jgi:hypothetical protein